MADSKDTCDFSRQGKTLNCRFAGRLGSNECPQIEDELDTRLDDSPESVVFDLAEVDFVSSAFLRVCLRTVRRLKGGGLAIVNSPSLVREVLATAGFDRVPQISIE